MESSSTAAPTQVVATSTTTKKSIGKTPDDTPSSTSVPYRPAETTIQDAINYFHFQNFVKPKNENFEKRFPTCIIIGAPNTGARELRDFLKLNPYIEVYDGEQPFFVTNDIYKKGYEWLKNEMPFSYSNQVTVIENDAYFHTSIVPERFYQYYKSIKLILVVKEPITRSISHFNYLLDETSIPKASQYSNVVLDSKGKGLNTQHQVLNMSIYDDSINIWLKYFNMSQFHIIESERLTREPAAVLAEVEEFLELGHFIRPDMFVFDQEKLFPCVRSNTTSNGMVCHGGNGTKPYASPETIASLDVIAKLKEFFGPRNERFFKLIGRSFAW